MQSSDSPPTSPCPDDIRKSFVAVAAVTDTAPPGDGLHLPIVPLGQSISGLASTVGMILHKAPLFHWGGALSTVDEGGQIRLMTADRFTSWVENYLAFSKAGKAESINKDMATKLLASDQMRDKLRDLKGVSQVRLPVFRGVDGSREVELAPVGYDPDTGIFTVDLVPYDDAMDDQVAWATIFGVLQKFPFDPEGEEVVSKRRSFSAQIGAMLGVYCHLLFHEGTPRPMIVHIGNQPGTGKSLLMRLVLAPVFGPPSESGKPNTESEFEKVLDATALARKPYLVLDDCKNIESQALNRFVTSPIHECRLMHTLTQAAIPKVTQVFCGGNGLKVTPDLDRRSLIIDLFEPGEATARTFEKAITPAWLFSDGTRSKLLAALWCFVKKWKFQGCPSLTEGRRGSFEEWSGLVGGIVTACGLPNPFVQRKSGFGGDEEGRALKELLCRIVGEYSNDEGLVLTPKWILERAEEEGVLDDIVGEVKSPNQALGHRLKSLKGRELLDSQRRAFQFGRRDGAAGAKYPVRFLQPNGGELV